MFSFEAKDVMLSPLFTAACTKVWLTVLKLGFFYVYMYIKAPRKSCHRLCAQSCSMLVLLRRLLLFLFAHSRLVSSWCCVEIWFWQRLNDGWHEHIRCSCCLFYFFAIPNHFGDDRRKVTKLIKIRELCIHMWII